MYLTHISDFLTPPRAHSLKRPRMSSYAFEEMTRRLYSRDIVYMKNTHFPSGKRLHRATRSRSSRCPLRRFTYVTTFYIISVFLPWFFMRPFPRRRTVTASVRGVSENERNRENFWKTFFKFFKTFLKIFLKNSKNTAFGTKTKIRRLAGSIDR